MAEFLNFLPFCVKKIILKCISILLAITSCFIYPTLIIVCIPLYIIRYIVANLAKQLRPDLVEMVTPRGSLIAADDLFNKPQCNVIVTMTVQGNVQMDRATENAGRTLLEARFPYGDLRYPKLKQYLTTWGGYYFWTEDKTFELKNHVKLHDKCRSETDRFTDDEIQEFRQELVQAKWMKERPLWDLTFVTNCYPKGATDYGPHTTAILRFHHSYGDSGYSGLFPLIEGLWENPIRTTLPNDVKSDPYALVAYLGTYPFRAVYNASVTAINSVAERPFGVTSKIQRGKFNANVTDRIRLSKLKEIKSYYQVSFSSVVYSVLAGAVRDMMALKRMDIPSTLPAITVLPIPGHYVKPPNYMTSTITTLLVGESDPVARLKLCFKNDINVQSSITPMLMQRFVRILGSYFTMVLNKFGKYQKVPSSLSNFPAGIENMSYDGHKCVDAMFTAGLQNGSTGLAFCVMSYEDGLRISAIANPAVLTKYEVKELCDFIKKQIDTLHQHVIPEV